MKQAWRFQSEDGDTISLHDCLIRGFKEMEGHILLHVADGFDVASSNSLNHTRRHKHTGPAVVVLCHSRFQKGAFNSGGIKETSWKDGVLQERTLAEIEMTEKMLKQAFTIEVLSSTWDAAQEHFLIFGQGWAEDEPNVKEQFCEIGFICKRVVYCWDNFVEDAWFQQ